MLEPFHFGCIIKSLFAGTPSWRLAMCLFGAWIIVFLIISRGVKSSGKCSYFLALFPYVTMLVLLIRAVTLEGASKGILFFLTPQWHELTNPKVNIYWHWILFNASILSIFLIFLIPLILPCIHSIDEKHEIKPLKSSIPFELASSKFVRIDCRFGVTPFSKYFIHYRLVCVPSLCYHPTINFTMIFIGE